MELKTKQDLKDLFIEHKLINDFWKKYYDYKYIKLKSVLYELKFLKRKLESKKILSKIQRRMLNLLKQLIKE